MRTILVVAAACGLFATSALAVSRHSSQSMTCAAVHDMVAREGSVVFYFPSSKKPDLMLYNRFVSSMTPCMGQSSMTSGTVPTLDDPKCKLKTCAASSGKGSVKGGSKDK
ncbi:hypothetical protein [Rhizobium sp. RAF56]|jgi:hypothetical protein|uniref:hypothetical protein n=1 Tax=Rhizobium sp. RAF56 TaxID=3233062 RepID=UPI003F967C6E